MECDRAQTLLEPLLDAELSVDMAKELKQHLPFCADCRRNLEELTELRSALRALPRINAPNRLHRKVRADIQAEAERYQSHPIRYLFHPLLTHAGAVAIGVALALGIAFLSGITDIGPEKYLDAHVASLKNDQLTQILASDTHKVKPWFEGKVDYAPIVVDLAGYGYPLIGGRVDLISRQKTAALVYKWNFHVINLFVTPTPDGDKFPVSIGTLKGFNYIEWRTRGFGFFAISGASADTLRAFSQDLRATVERN